MIWMALPIIGPSLPSTEVLSETLFQEGSKIGPAEDSRMHSKLL